MTFIWYLYDKHGIHMIISMLFVINIVRNNFLADNQTSLPENKKRFARNFQINWVSRDLLLQLWPPPTPILPVIHPSSAPKKTRRKKLQQKKTYLNKSFHLTQSIFSWAIRKGYKANKCIHKINIWDFPTSILFSVPLSCASYLCESIHYKWPVLHGWRWVN